MISEDIKMLINKLRQECYLKGMEDAARIVENSSPDSISWKTCAEAIRRNALQKHENE